MLSHFASSRNIELSVLLCSSEKHASLANTPASTRLLWREMVLIVSNGMLL
jgi:hypothetical protein